jgi:cytoskeletal protein CcmA (bactofilin family)
MKFRKDTPDEILSILGDGVEMSGDLSFIHGLRVDGLVKGKIRSESTLVIGPTGKVEAEATIRKISINGEFRGVIHASDRIEIRKEGKVYGDLYTPCLIIEAGALFEGKCNMAERRATKVEEPGILKAVESVESAKAVGSDKTWQK